MKDKALAPQVQAGDPVAAKQLANGYVLVPCRGRSQDGRTIFTCRWVRVEKAS